MPKHAFLENDGVLAFAHRGDQDAGPENTLAAFEGAVQQRSRTRGLTNNQSCVT